MNETMQGLDAGQRGIVDDLAAIAISGGTLTADDRGKLRAMLDHAGSSERIRIQMILIRTEPEKEEPEKKPIDTSGFDRGKRLAEEQAQAELRFKEDPGISVQRHIENIRREKSIAKSENRRVEPWLI